MSLKNIKLAFFLNLFFSLFELVGGLITNSVAIVSDAIHDFSDAIGLLISVLLEQKSNKRPNKKYTYGYQRYSVLGALITSMILLVGSLYVIYTSSFRLFNPVEVNTSGMLIFSIVGVTINGYIVLKTFKTKNLNEKAVSLHMLEDALGWIATLIASIVISFTKLYIIDPILSILIALVLLINVFKNLKDVLDLFLEKTPSNVDIDKLEHELKEVNNVLDIHHIHVWSLDNVNNYITLHVKVSNKLTFKELDQVKLDLRKIIKSHNIEHITLEVDFNKCQEKECHFKETDHHHHHHGES